MATDEPIIYCIEGHWGGDVEPSVEPMLQMLQGMGQWKYVRRNAATAGEMFYWLEHEWNYYPKGSILYLATHGKEGEIWLSNEEQPSASVPIEKLAMVMEAEAKAACKGCLVHFSGCKTLMGNADRIRRFIDKSSAAAVSGYSAEVGWVDRTLPPAALLELMLFSSIWQEGINLNHRKSRERLVSLKEHLQGSFPKCEFDLHLR